MVVIYSDGSINKDRYLISMYDEFLSERGETLETNEDYIPYTLGNFTYVCIKESEYNNMSRDDLNIIIKVLNNISRT